MEVKESLNFPLIAPEIMPNHTPSSSVVSGVVGCLPLAPSIDCQRKSTCDLITNNILQSRTSEAANNFVIEVYNLDKVKSRPRDRGKEHCMFFVFLSSNSRKIAKYLYGEK